MSTPLLQVARARLALGDAEREGASRWLQHNPVVSVGVGPGFNKVNNSIVEHVDYNASLSQQVDISGKRETRMNAAGKLSARLQAELEEARWAVHREVDATFHQALIARERMHAAHRLLSFQERLLDIARRRLQAGDVSPLAVRLAEGELSQAQVTSIAAEQDHVQMRLRLAELVGWSDLVPPAPIGDLEQPRQVPSTEQLMGLARSHQPRRKTLEAVVDEAKARVGAAEREAYPEPSFGLNVMRESFRYGPPEFQVLGTLSMPIPLFQQNQGGRAIARAHARVAKAEQQVFDIQLTTRLEKHRSAVEASAAQLRTYGSEILPRFEENLRLLQRAFELGEIDILAVSVARERFLRLQTDVLDAYTNYFQAVADLEASIGTDLWPHDHNHIRGAEPQAQGVE